VKLARLGLKGPTLRNCDRTVGRFRKKNRTYSETNLIYKQQMVISALTGFVAGLLHVLSGLPIFFLRTELADRKRSGSEVRKFCGT